MTRFAALGASLFLFAVIAAGCGDKADPLSAPMGGGNGADSPTYVQDVKSILDQNCLPCHSTSRSGAQRNGAPLTVNFNTYELAVANSERANARLQAGTMPPTGGLDAQLRATFLEWLADGTPRGEL